VGLASEEERSGRAHLALEGGGIALRLRVTPVTQQVLSRDEVGHRLVAAGGEMRTGRLRSPLEVALTPARLGEVGERIAIERPGSGHLLESRPGQGQHAASQVDPSQARLDRTARTIHAGLIGSLVALGHGR
jgi:hypothetical protein